MTVDIRGYALELLEDFVYYATNRNPRHVADALYYCEDELVRRALLLEKAVKEAKAGVAGQ